MNANNFFVFNRRSSAFIGGWPFRVFFTIL